MFKVGQAIFRTANGFEMLELGECVVEYRMVIELADERRTRVRFIGHVTSIRRREGKTLIIEVRRHERDRPVVERWDCGSLQVWKTNEVVGTVRGYRPTEQISVKDTLTDDCPF
jgi:hypothetical protein